MPAGNTLSQLRMIRNTICPDGIANAERLADGRSRHNGNDCDNGLVLAGASCAVPMSCRQM